jgi:hypothetical protein
MMKRHSTSAVEWGLLGAHSANGDGLGPGNSTVEAREQALFTCEIINLSRT